MQCPSCGREAPDGRYCGYCGAALASAPGRDSRRLRAFAINPREHVYQPALVTTFFPHLKGQRAQQVRWVLLGGTIAILLIALGRFVPLGYVAAAAFVPLLYLFYFYDVEIYEGEPLRVLGSCFLLSALLGAIANLALYRTLLSVEYTLPGEGPSPDFLVLSGIVVPLVSLLLALVGPLILFVARRRFHDVLDGLAFGVASGLGFAAAQSLVFSWQLVTGPFQQDGEAYSWLLPIAKTAILSPLLFAASIGLVCAVLWLRRDPAPPRRQLGLLASLPAALAVAALVLIVPALGSAFGGDQVVTILWYAGALLVAVLVVRRVVHVALVEKAHELGHGGTMRCPHCQHPAPDVPFCPTCGMALRATGKRTRRAALIQEKTGE